MSEKVMLKKNGIIYDLLQKKDLEQTINCVVNVFPSSEPLSKAVGFTQDEFYPFAKIVCAKAVDDRLSHVAKDAETGEVIGFRISEDLIQEPNPELNLVIKTTVKIKPIIALLENLEEEYIANKQIDTGTIFHFLMVGVNPAYRNRNIAKILIEKNMKTAREQKYQTIICEATGVISQHNALKLGFQEKISIYYKDYTYQGKQVFAAVAKTQKQCMLMEKKL